MKQVAILHTTPVTVQSLGALLRELAPDATVANFLDDSLLPEINREGAITPGVRARFYALAACAAMAKPDAMLCACSSVGGLVEESRAFVAPPFLRIDDPMAEEAVRTGSRIAVAATLPSTLGPTGALIARKAKALNKAITLDDALIEGAGALLAAGKTAEYEDLIAGRLGALCQNHDVIVLAQASMAGAAAKLGATPGTVILSSPRSGVQALADVLEAM